MNLELVIRSPASLTNNKGPRDQLSLRGRSGSRGRIGSHPNKGRLGRGFVSHAFRSRLSYRPIYLEPCDSDHPPRLFRGRPNQVGKILLGAKVRMEPVSLMSFRDA